MVTLHSTPNPEVQECVGSSAGSSVWMCLGFRVSLLFLGRFVQALIQRRAVAPCEPTA